MEEGGGGDPDGIRATGYGLAPQRIPPATKAMPTFRIRTRFGTNRFWKGRHLAFPGKEALGNMEPSA